MFKNSIRVGTIMGIPILFHISFLIILPFLAWAFANNIKSMANIAGISVERLGYSSYYWGFLVAITLFLSVILHELGHSYIALMKGIKIRSITLMLFGGLAQMEEIPEKPGEEAKIALAGPSVSFLIGTVCLIIRFFIDMNHQPGLFFSITYLGYINIFLGLFNIIPAFPMDGGRILRSFLARNRSFVEATRIAADAGKGFAFLFGIWGLLSGNFILIFIAFFIYLGASQEQQLIAIKSTLDGFRVRDLMTANVSTVNPDMTIEALIDKMMTERHMGYPVLKNDDIVGCVTLQDIQKIPPEERMIRKVSDIMSEYIISTTPDEDIYLALKKMSENEIGRLLVIEKNRLVGIISRTDILKGFKIRQLTQI